MIPLPRKRKIVQHVRDLPPSFHLERLPIRAGGRVEGDPISDEFSDLTYVVIGLPDADVSASGDHDVRATSIAFCQSSVHSRKNHLVGESLGHGFGDDQSIAQLSGQLTHTLVQSARMNSWSRHTQRSWIKVRGHQVDLVELAIEVDGFTCLPPPPQRSKNADVLLHSWFRRKPFHPEAALNVPFHLRPQAELEPAARHVLQMPCFVRCNRWTPGKRDQERRDNPRVGCLPQSHAGRQIGRALHFIEGDTRKVSLLRKLAQFTHFRQVVGPCFQPQLHLDQPPRPPRSHGTHTISLPFAARAKCSCNSCPYPTAARLRVSIGAAP